MALDAQKLQVGDTYSVVVCENLSRAQIVMYAGASGDYNPLHTDEQFAVLQRGQPSVFAHGMLTMGMTGRMLTDFVGDGRLTKYGARFTAQVWPGDKLVSSATVTDIRQESDAMIADFEISTVNQNGVEVLRGDASARLEP